MSIAAKHKKRAAEFELQKQFDKAVASYMRAIEAGDAEGAEVDVAVLNKLGDLTLRLGRVAEAVASYERAVEHYASVGLFNNAIALCNKILRHAPGRAGVYLTLGRICARKGMRGDATRNLLEYASRMKQEGRTDEAMRSLAEVANLMPELEEVRRLVTEHAERAGIALSSGVEAAAAAPQGGAADSLVFLDIDYDAPTLLTPPIGATSIPPMGAPLAPASPPEPPPRTRSLDDLLIFDPTTEEPDVDVGGPVDGFEATVEAALDEPVPSLLTPPPVLAVDAESVASPDGLTDALGFGLLESVDSPAIDALDGLVSDDVATPLLPDPSLIDEPEPVRADLDVVAGESEAVRSDLDVVAGDQEVEVVWLEVAADDLTSGVNIEAELVTESPFVADVEQEPRGEGGELTWLVDANGETHTPSALDGVEAVEAVEVVEAVDVFEAVEAGDVDGAIEPEPESIEVLGAADAFAQLDDVPRIDILDVGDMIEVVHDAGAADEVVDVVADVEVVDVVDAVADVEVVDVVGTGDAVDVVPEESSEPLPFLVITPAGTSQTPIDSAASIEVVEGIVAKLPVEELAVEEIDTIESTLEVIEVGQVDVDSAIVEGLELAAEEEDEGSLADHVALQMDVEVDADAADVVAHESLAIIAEPEVDRGLDVESRERVADEHHAVLVDDEAIGVEAFGDEVPGDEALDDVLAGVVPLHGVELAAPSNPFREPVAARPIPRLNPHDFILPGELPPIVLPDAMLGIARPDLAEPGETPERGASAIEAQPVEAQPVEAPAVEAPAVEAPPVDARAVETAEAADEPAPAPEHDPLDGALEGAFVRAFSGVYDAIRDSDEVDAQLSPPRTTAAVVNLALERCRRLREEVEAHPGDWARRRRLAEALLEAGELETGLQELAATALALELEGALPGAMSVLDDIVRLAPEEVSHHQKRVELAVRMGDRERLRESYLDLADTLVRSGQSARAEPVYVRVLELDPWDDRARSALGDAAPPPPAHRPPPARADDGYVSFSDWMAEDDEPRDTRMRVQEPTATGDEDADFDRLLQHFREGVARSLGDDDFDSHYDLGVAYKEMGLLDDAIAEFQRALRSPSHRLPAYEALGQCFLEQGSFPVAVTVLSRALHEPGLDDAQRIGVLYLLGYACEALQRRDEARSYYQRVYSTDQFFRDVAERLAALDRGAQ